MQRLSLITLMVLLFAGGAAAQAAKNAAKGPASDAGTHLVLATQEFQAKSRELAELQEKELSAATAKIEQLRELVTEGLVAKAELEQHEESLAALRAKLTVTQQQIATADQMIAKVRAAEAAAKAQLAVARVNAQNAKSQSFLRPTVMRYSGSASWSLTNLAGIQSFFVSQFGRGLPTSAVGQSATHNQLGYDHRNAVDVALHPDSVEGQTLINYLRSQGIPFLAFRGAIPGVATGAHIHIGSPSHRLS